MSQFSDLKLCTISLVRKPCLAMLLKQRNYSVLHLKRDNLLDVYISSQNIHKLKPHLRVLMILMQQKDMIQ